MADLKMCCNLCKSEDIVENYVLHEKFYYCRSCKQESNPEPMLTASITIDGFQLGDFPASHLKLDPPGCEIAPKIDLPKETISIKNEIDAVFLNKIKRHLDRYDDYQINEEKEEE